MTAVLTSLSEYCTEYDLIYVLSTSLAMSEYVIISLIHIAISLIVYPYDVTNHIFYHMITEKKNNSLVNILAFLLSTVS